MANVVVILANPVAKRGEVAVRRGDQAQVRVRRVDQQLAEIFFTLGDEVGEAALRRGYTEACMQVRAFEVDVDDHDALTESCERRCKIRRDERLANTALATADGE